MNMTDEEIIAYWRGAYDRMAARSIEDGARIAKLEAALKDMLKRYVDLAGSGDCGFWNPEDEDEVIAARAALEAAP